MWFTGQRQDAGKDPLHGGIRCLYRKTSHSTIHGVLLGNWNRRKVVIVAQRALPFGPKGNPGLGQSREPSGRDRRLRRSPCIGQHPYNQEHGTQFWCNCDSSRGRAAPQPTPNSSNTSLVFRRISTCLCSFPVFVREPLGAYKPFC